MSVKEQVYEVHEIIAQKVGHVPVAKGDFNHLPRNVKTFVAHCVHLCGPRGIYICDGSHGEAEGIIHKLLDRGTLTRLTKYKNNYLCRTDPDDVARVESKTFIVTKNKYNSVPNPCEGVAGILGNWMSPEDAKGELDQRFPGCMAGRIMYVIPFIMGPVGSSLSKIGVQVTDSNYVLLCMRIMTRVTPKVWEILDSDDFVKCIHSMGCPRPVQKRVKNHWSCNPEKVMIVHFPEERKIKSFGSGYGGNALLSKKCFALRIASVIARDEGWMAEHMLIMSVTTPKGKEHFVAAAFPNGCGKTNLAMLNPSLPGFKVQCVGDDVAWMRFDDCGVLHGINPDNGFFGVAPGINKMTNPYAMLSFQSNSIFTNVAETADGGYYWEGLEKESPEGIGIIDWTGKPWHPGCVGKAAHPNSRFTAPASQCPIMHPKWGDPHGVPISAIIFGGHRPVGVPLVFEAKNWAHGVMIGACIKSETIAAADHQGRTLKKKKEDAKKKVYTECSIVNSVYDNKIHGCNPSIQTGKNIMHDPMAMRSFIGYNFGHYLQHWLDLEKPGHKMPKIFHINWFRVDLKGQLLWPGYGDNIRVLDWIIRRCEGESSIAKETPIGYLPKKGTIDLSGLESVDEEALFSLPKHYWLEDTKESIRFLKDQIGSDTPRIIIKMLDQQQEDCNKLLLDNADLRLCPNQYVTRCYISQAKAQKLRPI